MAIQDLIQQNLTPEKIDQISKQIGADPATTRQAVQAAVPMIMGSVSTPADLPETQAPSSPDITMLGGFGGLGGILGSMLGGHHEKVQDGVAQASGLDTHKAQRLLMIVAPIVLAAIAKHRSESGASTAQVNSDLQREAQSHAANNHHVGGVLGSILGKAGAFRNP